jgi:uncharacterized protein (TIGR04255 family)
MGGDLVTERNRTLPDYDDPPVIETVLGVEFPPLQGWSIPHFGLFWNEYKSEYPSFEVQPRLAGQFDKNVGVENPGIANTSLSAGAPVRCWFFNADKTRLIQVQDNRFMHNWIKAGPSETYPHYEKIRPRFERDWGRFLRFLDEQKIERPETLRWEVTYVNHLEKGREWNSFSDLPDVLSPWAGKGSIGFLPSADAILLNIRYPMPAPGTSLTVSVEHAVRRGDKREVLQVRLTAQGKPASSEIDSLVECLNQGRSWIVNGFTDITTAKMHKFWRRKI